MLPPCLSSGPEQVDSERIHAAPLVQARRADRSRLHFLPSAGSLRGGEEGARSVNDVLGLTVQVIRHQVVDAEGHELTLLGCVRIRKLRPHFGGNHFERLLLH